MTLHLRATGRQLPYGITQYYLPPDTSEHANSRQTEHLCLLLLMRKQIPRCRIPPYWLHRSLSLPSDVQSSSLLVHHRSSHSTHKSLGHYREGQKTAIFHHQSSHSIQKVSTATRWAKKPPFSIINLNKFQLLQGGPKTTIFGINLITQTISFSCYTMGKKTIFNHQSSHSNNLFQLLQGGPKNSHFSSSIWTFKQSLSSPTGWTKKHHFTINLNIQKMV